MRKTEYDTGRRCRVLFIMMTRKYGIMIGTNNITLSDPLRKEVLGKKDGYRKVTVRFYYPCKEDPDMRKTDGLTDVSRKWMGRKKNFALYDSRIALYEDAVIKDGRFPLILFNHGYGGFTEQNNDLCRYLAEQNYIVASVGHSYEAGETVYEDGTSTFFDRYLRNRDEDNAAPLPVLSKIIEKYEVL